jgi:hypothetical protein
MHTISASICCDTLGRAITVGPMASTSTVAMGSKETRIKTHAPSGAQGVRSQASGLVLPTSLHTRYYLCVNYPRASRAHTRCMIHAAFARAREAATGDTHENATQG